MTTEQFELRKARRWPWLAALVVIVALAVAFGGGGRGPVAAGGVWLHPENPL